MGNQDDLFEKEDKKLVENKVALVTIIISAVAVICSIIAVIVGVSSCNRVSLVEEIQNSILENVERDNKNLKENTTQKETTDKETTTAETTVKETTTQKANASKATTTVSSTKTQETTTPRSLSNNTGNNSNIDSNNSSISKLSVKGTKIVNASGQAVVLNGISTHGIAWFPQYINKEAFQSVKNTFGANVIRIAMYSEPSAGYYEGLWSKVDEAVEYAKQVGLYVIIDWHILGDGNPNTYKSEAIKFFTYMSAKYKNCNNVLYEICNEPNGNVSWANDIKPYAIDLIKTIRANDPDGIILVGTPTWSQDVDVVADDPIKGYSNIMYTLHFYAATHTDWNRQKLITAINKGLPVFVSEFSICAASGNGWNDINSGNEWMKLLDRYNISFVGWSLCNKDEKASILSTNCWTTGGWSDNDLSESGRFLIEQLRKH